MTDNDFIKAMQQGLPSIDPPSITGLVVTEYSVTEAKDEAAARLAAAAPELLKALERIARPHDCGCVPCTGSCRSQLALQITVEEMQDLAQAAIAKATGAA